jgi:hypothetical protein
MAIAAEVPERRLLLALHAAPSILWLGRFDPPLPALPARSEVTVGRWHAPTSTIAHTMIEDDGSERLLIDANVRFLSQLRHALLREPGDVLEIALEPALGAGPALAGVEKAHLEAVIAETEAQHGLGLRTRHFSPPVYLQHFWGGAAGRTYGALDAAIARFSHFNIVPAPLLAKARDPQAAKSWAVVVPADLPGKPQVLAALEGLIRHRDGTVFELDGRDSRTIDDFVARLANLPLEERPYYLLLVGDLDTLSIEFQYFLQSFGAAGRLHFDDVADYRRYAEKVVRHEAALGDDRPVAAFVATDTDNVAALNAEELVRPLAVEFAADAAVLADGRATKPRVLARARTLPERGILFLAAHGYERDDAPGLDRAALDDDQRAFQGAPILDDFVGRRGLGGTRGLLCAADLADGAPFVPGGIVVLHACHSAGTVRRDTLPEWIHLPTPRRRIPERPFVSRLSQAMLASAAGPVAVYGHINRSHQYAWYDPERPKEPLTRGQYRDLLATLMRGDPVGLGRESARRMAIKYMDQAITISYQIEWLLTGKSRRGGGIGWPRKGVAPYERSFVQYSFGSCNFRNYVILGDPMARLAKPAPPPGQGGVA